VYTFRGSISRAFDAHPIMNWFALAFAAGWVASFFVTRANLRRHHLSWNQIHSRGFLASLDDYSAELLAWAAVGFLVWSARDGTIQLFSPSTLAGLAFLAIFVFVWGEGRRQIQFQRPTGIVLGESLILAGVWVIAEHLVFRASPEVWHGPVPYTLGVGAILVGTAIIAAIVPPFVKGYEGHRILESLEQQSEIVQPEYVPPTHECPHPEHWKMVDSQTSELEVLEFLKSIVLTVKPGLIVETGTFIGYSAIKMAEGLKANGFGRIITIEYDPAIFAKAKQRIDSSGLGNWIEYRNASSLESKIEGTIDIFFSDSHLPIREDEIRKFLPQINPQGLILVHDASSHFAVVRDAVLRLEAEGLISTVLLSTPRGMVVAQKRAGRK
jgi:predicted O-methyltransferase YrrM